MAQMTGRQHGSSVAQPLSDDTTVGGILAVVLDSPACVSAPCPICFPPSFTPPHHLGRASLFIHHRWSVESVALIWSRSSPVAVMQPHSPSPLCCPVRPSASPNPTIPTAFAHSYDAAVGFHSPFLDDVTAACLALRFCCELTVHFVVQPYTSVKPHFCAQ